jgi:hypothetical protein
MNGTKMPPPRRKAIQRLIEAGKSDLFISQELHACRHTVAKIRRELGVPPKAYGSPKIDPAKFQQIEAMLRRGKSNRQIASATRVTRDTVRHVYDQTIRPEFEDMLCKLATGMSCKEYLAANKSQGQQAHKNGVRRSAQKTPCERGNRRQRTERRP